MNARGSGPLRSSSVGGKPPFVRVPGSAGSNRGTEHAHRRAYHMGPARIVMPVPRPAWKRHHRDAQVAPCELRAVQVGGSRHTRRRGIQRQLDKLAWAPSITVSMLRARRLGAVTRATTAHSMDRAAHLSEKCAREPQCPPHPEGSARLPLPKQLYIQHVCARERRLKHPDSSPQEAIGSHA
jgi:hypothetical protein